MNGKFLCPLGVETFIKSKKEFDNQNPLKIELKNWQIFHCAGNSQIIHFSKLEQGRLVCSKVTSLLLSHFRHFTT